MHGSRDICASPCLFAAYRVLRRLREPRHSPCALLYFLHVTILHSPPSRVFCFGLPTMSMNVFALQQCACGKFSGKYQSTRVTEYRCTSVIGAGAFSFFLSTNFCLTVFVYTAFLMTKLYNIITLLHCNSVTSYFVTLQLCNFVTLLLLILPLFLCSPGQI
jgi:hypothetical protein